MIKLNKNVFLAMALIVSLIGLIGCDRTETNTANNTTVVTNTANTTTPANTTAAPNTNTETANTTTAAGDKIGVAECDDYVEKYEACLNTIAGKYPQAAPALKSAYETQRDAFRKAAANPQAKAGLAAGCKQAIETAKQATSAYACQW
jgi:hypothetical protein